MQEIAQNSLNTMELDINQRLQKRGNQLTGKEWLKNSISIWSDIRKSPEEIKLKHPGLFPSALVRKLIECFSNPFDIRVLDPFCGSGSTIVAAEETHKEGIGFELYYDFLRLAEDRVNQVSLSKISQQRQSTIYNANSRDLLKYIKPASIDLVITSPPYWNILQRKRTSDHKETRNYGQSELDLGNIDDYERFLIELCQIFKDVYSVLKPNKYCCIIVMDIRKKDKFYPLHMDISIFMRQIGFILDDIIIWDRRQEYNNMKPLGYPYVFRVNKVHEYILIFKKPLERKDG